MSDAEKIKAIRAMAEAGRHEIEQGDYFVVKPGQIESFLRDPEAFATRKAALPKRWGYGG
jgi:hypothetical protein